jgi:hypothetical protein
MIPEQAVIAFKNLDGTSFQGRFMHIIPAKNKNDHSTSTSADDTLNLTADKDSSVTSVNLNV